MATRKFLSDKEYFLRETNTNNSYLNLHDLDTVVGSGFHSFYIVGSRYLEKGSEIEFEIVDSAGNAVEIAGVRSIRKGNARIISFSITDDVANGGAILYVSATLNKYLDENNFPISVPSEWEGKTNLLFSYNFTIDKDRINSDDIIFRKKPQISVTPKTEEVKRVNKQSITVSTGSGGSALTGSVVKSKQISESEYVVEFEADNSVFNSEMNNGSLRFVSRKYLDSNQNQKTFSYINYQQYPTDNGYEGNINFVRDGDTIEAVFENPDINLFGDNGNISYVNTFIPTNQDIIFEVDYTTTPYNEEILAQQKTYADIILRDLQTVSGDVELIKIYTKSDSEGTNYSLKFEGEVDEQESLLETIDNFDIGFFNTSSKLTEWTASDATNSNNTPTDPTPEFLLSDDLLIQGAVISGSNDVFTINVEGNELQSPLYSLESNTSFTLYRDIDYRISLNTAVEDVISDDTRLDVYISGSGLPSGVGNRFGNLVYSFRTNADKKWYSDEIEIIYNGDHTLTDARIIFVVTSGKWHLSNVEVLPQILQGFSAGEYRTQIPLEILRPNQDIDFKFEFYNAAGDKSSTVLFEDNVIFERPNLVIEGDQNLVTGSLFVGQNTGSGVQFGSSGNGGNFASVGYQGFDEAINNTGPSGFLIFSGSVLPSSATSYQGVGLELVVDSSSYFKYRTNPEELTVRTDNFFFGSDNQYISGSNGNIEISSSVFFLDPSTDTLIISGAIEAQVARIGGFVVSDDALTATSSGFYLSGSAVNDEFFISSSNFNVKANGDVSGSSVLFDGGKIGGWAITNTYLSSSNLIINSDGTLSTADFADGVRGWIISSQGNGSAQFENVKIRGTLRTTVFEKETVNAVGGQLWVANSTALSESISATDTTMSVENVTGFETDEVLLIKKVDGTGFNSEYVLVQSSSRTFPSSETNLSGLLYVQRAYASGSATGSGVTWVSELASSAEDYTEGQVIVSTGRPNTGWILLNASPSNDYTPYLDIIERTGSGVYDYNLEVRLGDLSGLSSAQLNGDNPTTAGFGLFSENVYLTGTVNARTGSIGEWEIIDGKISGSNITLDADLSEIYKTDQGPGTDPQAPGFEQLADEYYIDFTPAGVNPNPFYVKFGPNFSVDLSGSLFASGAVFEGTITASAGVIGGWIIESSSLHNAGNTVYLSGSATGNEISFYSNGNFIVRANGQMTASDALITGKITADTGSIGGFDILSTEIKSTNNNLRLKANGEITASDAFIDGFISSSAGFIGGFTLEENKITSFLADTGSLTLNSSNQSITMASYFSGSGVNDVLQISPTGSAPEATIFNTLTPSNFTLLQPGSSPYSSGQTGVVAGDVESDSSISVVFDIDYTNASQSSGINSIEADLVLRETGSGTVKTTTNTLYTGTGSLPTSGRIITNTRDFNQIFTFRVVAYASGDLTSNDAEGTEIQNISIEIVNSTVGINSKGLFINVGNNITFPITALSSDGITSVDVSWGNIDGDIDNQTDLSASLAGKLNISDAYTSWFASDGSSLINVTSGSTLTFIGGNDIEVTASGTSLTFNSTAGTPSLGQLTNVVSASDSANNLQGLVYNGISGFWEPEDIVNSVFGRTGNVTAEESDYDNFFYTQSYIDNNFDNYNNWRITNGSNTSNVNSNNLVSILPGENIVVNKVGNQLTISASVASTIEWNNVNNKPFNSVNTTTGQFSVVGTPTSSNGVLTLPQDLGSVSTPTFGGMTLDGNLDMSQNRILQADSITFENNEGFTNTNGELSYDQSDGLYLFVDFAGGVHGSSSLYTIADAGNLSGSNGIVISGGVGANSGPINISISGSYDNYNNWRITNGSNTSNVNSNNLVSILPGENIVVNKVGNQLTISASALTAQTASYVEWDNVDNKPFTNVNGTDFTTAGDTLSLAETYVPNSGGTFTGDVDIGSNALIGSEFAFGNGTFSTSDFAGLSTFQNQNNWSTWYADSANTTNGWQFREYDNGSFFQIATLDFSGNFDISGDLTAVGGTFSSNVTIDGNLIFASDTGKHSIQSNQNGSFGSNYETWDFIYSAGGAGTNLARSWEMIHVDDDSGDNNRYTLRRWNLQADYTTDTTYEAAGVDFFGDTHFESEKRGMFVHATNTIYFIANTDEQTGVSSTDMINVASASLAIQSNQLDINVNTDFNGNNLINGGSFNLDSLTVTGITTINPSSDTALYHEFNENSNGPYYRVWEGATDSLVIRGYSNAENIQAEFNDGGVQVTSAGNEETLINLNSERNWVFEQTSSGATSGLQLRSVGGGGNKHLHIRTDGITYFRDEAGAGAVSINHSSPEIQVDGNTVFHAGNSTNFDTTADETITGDWTFERGGDAQSLTLEAGIGQPNPLLRFTDSAGAGTVGVIYGDLSNTEFRIVAGGSDGISLRVNGNTTTNPALQIDSTQTASFYGQIRASGSTNNTTGGGANTFINPITGLIQRSTSSERYKENIIDLSDIYDSEKIIGELRPVHFTHKDDGKKYVGLIAEEVDEVLSELVDYKNGEPENVHYSHIVSVLIDHNKKLQSEVSGSKNRISELERRVNQLEKLIVSGSD